MMEKVNVTIDGRKTSVPKNSTVLMAAGAMGIKIPTLCFLKDVNEVGACRMCVVEVNTSKSLEPACIYPVSEGLEVKTSTEAVYFARKSVLEFLISNHKLNCIVCDKNGECRLQDLCYEYEVEKNPFENPDPDYPVDESNPFYNYDKSKCIRCRRCVSVCSKTQCNNTICLDGRGYETKISVPMDKGLANSRCVSCGNCVGNCPVGALTYKRKTKYRSWEIGRTKTTCTFCAVGCELNLLTKFNKVVGVEASYGAANKGLTCVKGRFGYEFINHKDRLTKPLVRKDGKLVESNWDEAFNIIVTKLKEIKGGYGPHALAGFSSAKATNEENYLFQKMIRAVIGTNNVDHCARLCHASTVTGLAATLGSGAMTNSIEEVLGSDLIFVTGSNTTENHPVIAAKMRQAKLKGAKIIVAEPRRIALCEDAELFLQIKPGTNVALINGMMNVIISENLNNKQFVEERAEGFEAMAELVKNYTPEIVAEICGIPEEDLKKAARMYATANKAGIYYAMGVTQHHTGTRGVMSMSNLAVLCGHIGRESTGVNPLRGQNNVQGSTDMGACPWDFPGYQKVADPDILRKFKSAWKMPLSDRPGLSVTEIIHEAEKKNIRGMVIMGENPMVSDPDVQHVEKALKSLDFLAVIDIFLTETAQLADVVLPACSFAEKDGTFTNTERRVQRVRKAINPVGTSRPDWRILLELMQRLGYEKHYDSPEEIFNEMTTVTPIYAGINYKRIDSKGIQWPCPDDKHPGTPILHVGSFTRGKALLMPIEYTTSAELPDSEYPLILTTGRVLYHWHTKTMTGKVEGLNKLSPGAYVEMNPALAGRLGIANGETVRATTRRGSILTKARVTDIIEEDVVFMPFHFTDGLANTLTNPVVDPTAKIPEFKVCAVRIDKIEEPERMAEVALD